MATLTTINIENSTKFMEKSLNVASGFVKFTNIPLAVENGKDDGGGEALSLQFVEFVRG